MDARQRELWLTSAGPAWIQTVCTVLALIAGLVVYSSWQEQELARRKADLALEILKNGYVLKECIGAARRGFWIEKSTQIEIGNGTIERFIKVVPTKVDDCSKDIATFATNANVAGRLLGKEVIEAMVDVQNHVWRIRNASSHLAKWYTAEFFDGWHPDAREDWRRIVRQDIEAVGMCYSGSNGGVMKCEADDDLSEKVNALARSLDRFIEFY